MNELFIIQTALQNRDGVGWRGPEEETAAKEGRSDVEVLQPCH